jgi:hypothetical protein
MDCARNMMGAKALAEDLDLKCPREYGEVFRGRKGNVGDDHPGDCGEDGVGSVDLRIVYGFEIFETP